MNLDRDIGRPSMTAAENVARTKSRLHQQILLTARSGLAEGEPLPSAAGRQLDQLRVVGEAVQRCEAGLNPLRLHDTLEHQPPAPRNAKDVVQKSRLEKPNVQKLRRLQAFTSGS